MPTGLKLVIEYTFVSNCLRILMKQIVVFHNWDKVRQEGFRIFGSWCTWIVTDTTKPNLTHVKVESLVALPILFIYFALFNAVIQLFTLVTSLSIVQLIYCPQHPFTFTMFVSCIIIQRQFCFHSSSNPEL